MANPHPPPHPRPRPHPSPSPDPYLRQAGPRRACGREHAPARRRHQAPGARDGARCSEIQGIMCSRALAPLALALALTRWSCRCRVATHTPPRCATRTRCGSGASARVISPVSPLCLPCISPASPLHLRHISPTRGAALGLGVERQARHGGRRQPIGAHPRALAQAQAPAAHRVWLLPHDRALGGRRHLHVGHRSYISPISPHISPIYISSPGASASAASWTLISPTSRLHLAYISPTSRRRARPAGSR